MSSEKPTKQELQARIFTIEFEIHIEEADLESLQRKYESLGDRHMFILQRDDKFARWVKETSREEHIVLRQRVVGQDIFSQLRLIEYLKCEVTELKKKLEACDEQGENDGRGA